MFEQFIILILLYFYLFFVGIGSYCFLTPKYLQKTFMLPFLAPMCGLILMSIINVYYLYSNSHVTKSIYPLSALGAISLLFAIFYKKEVFIDTYKKILSLNKFDFLKMTLIIFFLILILSPTLRASYPTTPYRVGVDQVGYAGSGQFLLDGGTYKAAEDNIKAQFNEPNIFNALKKEHSALNFNALVASEFILNWPRGGYVTIIATLTSLVKRNFIYETEFILLIFPYALISALGYFLMRYKLNRSSNFSYLIAIALALNCNMLNVYYEGQYAQIFFMPMAILLLIFYLSIRESEEKFKLKSMLSYNSNYSILFPSLLVAGIGSSYFESLILLIGFCGFTIVYDIIGSKKTNNASIITMISSFFAGLIIVLPHSIKVIQAMIRLYSQFSTSGFWQPKWASITEIMGIFNMYTPQGTILTPYTLLARNNFELTINILSSILIIGAIYVVMRKAPKLDKAFWLAAPTIISLVYLKSRSFEHLHNYQYMKAYTIFLPLIFVLSFFAIDFVSKLTESKKKTIINSIKYFLLFAVIFSGLSYINQYNAESGYVTKDMYALNTFSKKVDLNSYVIISEKSVIVGIKEHMLIPLIPFNWLNYADNLFVEPSLSKKVAIIIDRSKLDCPECFIQKHADNIIYSNPSYILIDTRIPLSKGYNYKTGVTDWKYFLKNYDTLNP